MLVRATRSVVSRLAQPAPCFAGVRHMGMYDEKERGEEVRYS